MQIKEYTYKEWVEMTQLIPFVREKISGLFIKEQNILNCLITLQAIQSHEELNNLDSNETSYFVDIDMNSLFPAYLSETSLDTFVFDNSPYDTTMYIDTTGFAEYTWNVVTQNYSRDRASGR